MRVSLSIFLLGSISFGHTVELTPENVLGTTPVQATTCNAVKSFYQHASLTNGGDGCCGNEGTLNIPECNVVSENLYTYDLPMKYSISSYGVFVIKTYNSLEELEDWKATGKRIFNNYKLTHTAVGKHTTWKGRMVEPMWTWSASKKTNNSGVLFYTTQFQSFEDIERHAFFGPRADYEITSNRKWVFGKNEEGEFQNSFQTQVPSVNLPLSMIDTLFDTHFPTFNYSGFGYYTSNLNLFLPFPPVTLNARPITIVMVDTDSSTSISSAQKLMKLIKNDTIAGPVSPHGRSTGQGLETGSLTHPFVLDAFSSGGDTFSYVVAYFIDITALNGFRNHDEYLAWESEHFDNILINTLNSSEYEDLQIQELLTE